MDALKVFYQVRHDQSIFDALLAKLRYVFAAGNRFQAMAAVHCQCAYVLRSNGGQRPSGRQETGGLLGSVTTAAEALELCARYQPQVLITYDRLEDGDGLELVRQARQRWPELPILLVLEQLSLPRLRQALRCGSTGILTDALIAEGYVLHALQTVLQGETYLDPSLDALLKQGGRGWDPALNPRHLQILQALVNGLSDREIATALAMPYDTVRHQLKLIYRELGTSNRCHAGLVALQLRLVEPPQLPSVAVARSDAASSLRQFAQLTQMSETNSTCPA
ncbi:MAG: response regulator transcription factor [Cyanobacteriota bacterium]|nr:response regulator transcription factor [Cyanobacteriota bacterium]